MDKTHSKIINGIRYIAHKPHPVLSGKVISVDEDNALMNVVVTADVDDNIAMEGILISAVSGNLNGIILIPAVNSDVVVAQIDGPSTYTLVKTSKLDKLIVTIGDSKITMSTDGYKIERTSPSGTESLTKLFSDLLTAILNLQVTTGDGPSGTPINAATFQQLLNRISTLLI